MLDGEIYTNWARALAAGESGPAGAFYQAPLYPWLLSIYFRIVGENFSGLYLLQQVLSVATAGGVALLARRSAGDRAGWFAAVLFLLYPPTTFFSSRPLGEPLALLLLVGALLLQPLTREGSPWRSGLAGAVAGLATLARPNLLLVPLAWGALLFVGRRPARGGWVLLGLVLVLTPVAVRNRLASGHWVPVTSNAGMTAYHGNGPDAWGIFTPPRGFSGSVLDQRREATHIARQRSGRQLDDVEADRWWGSQAVAARLDDIPGSLRLALVRVGLTLDNHEHGLDYSPALDDNPWRTTWRFPEYSEIGIVPLALLLGLAGAGVALGGIRHSGGSAVWAALAAAAAMPLLFYVSSRYRLPFTALLPVPAGCGLAALLGVAEFPTLRKRTVGAVVAIVGIAVSFLVPSSELQAEARVNGLANLAAAYEKVGDTTRALALAEQAVATAPESPVANFNLGVIEERVGRDAPAEAHFREALRRNPDLVQASVNLSALLLRQGRAGEAIPVLRDALGRRADRVDLWTNLLVALVSLERIDEAMMTIGQCGQQGIALDPELIETVNQLVADGDGHEGREP